MDSEDFLSQTYGAKESWSTVQTSGGHFINFDSDVTAIVTNCTFINGIGSDGAAVQVGKRSQVNISESLFLSNYASQGSLKLV